MTTLANTQIANVSQIVGDKINIVGTWANEAITAATDAINGVGTFATPVLSYNLPAAPGLMTPELAVVTIEGDVVTSNPVVSSFTSGEQVGFADPPPVPEPSYKTPIAPNDAPGDGTPTNPYNYPTADKPDIPEPPNPTSPTEPDFSYGTRPGLLSVNVPDFVAPTIPQFTDTIPTYVEPPPIQAPPLVPTDLDISGLKARIDELLAGFTIDMVALRNYMRADMVSPIDRELLKTTKEMFGACAAQNHSYPSGALVEALDEAKTAGHRKIREGMGKINDELAKISLQNYQTAVTEALVLEKVLVAIHLEQCRQLLEAEKIRVQGQIALFNAVVQMYNAQCGMVSKHVETYRAAVHATLQVLSAYPVMVEGAVAEVAENDQQIEMFSADAKILGAASSAYRTRVQEISAKIDGYKAQLSGVQAQTAIIAANIESYRSAISGYAAAVEASSAHISAVSAETQAKSSEIGVDSANVQAYAAFIQESAKRGQAYRTYASAQGEVLRANVQAFSSAADANQAYVRAIHAASSATTEIASSMTNAYNAVVSSTSEYNQAVAQNSAAEQGYALAAAENLARSQALNATAQAETDRINAGALAAKASALSALAQGAMTALHVSATAEGSGAMTGSATYQRGVDSVWGGTTSKNDVNVERASI